MTVLWLNSGKRVEKKNTAEPQKKKSEKKTVEGKAE